MCIGFVSWCDIYMMCVLVLSLVVSHFCSQFSKYLFFYACTFKNYFVSFFGGACVCFNFFFCGVVFFDTFLFQNFHSFWVVKDFFLGQRFVNVLYVSIYWALIYDTII
jgi:hypothetical protein